MKDAKSLTLYKRSLDAARPMTAEQERSELLAYKAGDRDAGDRVVVAHQRYVMHVAIRYGHRGRNLEDLIQEGNIGLLIALHKYDPRYENRFVIYAHSWVHRMMQDHMERTRRLARVPRDGATKCAMEAVAHGASSEAEIESVGVGAKRASAVLGLLTGRDESIELGQYAGDEETAIDYACREEARARVRAAMATLPDRWLEVIVRRFWHEQTLVEIGDALSVSKQAIEQTEKKAIAHLRHKLRSIRCDYEEAA